MSYVTGTHSVKTGVQWGFGPYTTRGDLNGDLIQLYRNGRADSVRVYNTPREAKEYLNADLGIFAQDSWRIERLTINYGVRLEYFNGEITDQAAPAGRFIGARSFEPISCMPCWTDWTPRFGVAYDLFGNARTALKASVNKYMAGQTLGFAQRYNPFSTQSDVRSWADLNGDDVAQDNEIAAIGNNLRFGEPVLTRRPADDIGREYDWEYSAGIQHELMRGVSVTAAWYHRDSYNMTQSVNGPFTPADYAVVNVVSPIDGALIPAYNLNSAKQGQVDRVDVNATDGNLRSFTYTGFEFGAAARMGRATLFGGWTIDRTTINHCDELENWGNLSGGLLRRLRQQLAAAEVRLSRSAISLSRGFRSCTSSSCRAGTSCRGKFRSTRRCRATPVRSWRRAGTSAGQRGTRRTASRRACRGRWSSRT